VRSLAAELDRVVEGAHGAEIARAEHRMRLDQIAGRAAEEFGVDAATLVAEYGPGVLIPVPEQPGDDGKPGRPANRGVAGGCPPAAAERGVAGGRPPAAAEREVAARGGGRLLAATEPGTAPLPAANGHSPRPNGHHPRLGATLHLNGDQPRPPAEDGDQPAGEPANVRLIRYVRAEQERRAATAQRQLDQLGKVNPLALEEYEALGERHAFLASQLEDLKKTRRDLLTVIKEVDDRVQQVFASAFADTAAGFENIFARLFPGGEGRLVLTEPDDMLATGIDVEARPAGKKVKRLSLLSGGERSLTAIAYLVAIFRARPSPFYVLDEVEAALDDTNLQRLLSIFDELRDSSQLIIVTHQRRTMEAADALYGVSMQGDGVSAVVSQRLREPARV
jgi:chromosome segregation protein